MTQWLCALDWRDNNGHKSESRVFYSGGLSLAAVAARATALADAAQAVSTAAIVGFELSRKYKVAAPPPPTPLSDSRARLVLFYRNSTDAAMLAIPSPLALLVDTIGPYAYVRLQSDAATVIPLLAAIEAELALTITPAGDPWPLPTIAGGFTRYQGEP